ncbi:hypothetical protein EJF18_11133 [Clavispora lusitaniae]|uniref:Uncharacterized protein n=2 Tax=Clavispora lusitaniae TaxID=36911 RepID=A0ACD0WFG3_CLALS|nr:hypothetical protein E0198_000081 [Clavispora lusitaniae]KAF7584970.1 hypothetical protein FOB63_001042 [Clavispora lusitaniae]OVF08226.1 hypothetical protein A9F13_09g01606 [Clavispora lusitaniae]QFZ26008.1 hypothetical protein EJF14_11133 [Clavispora lusitaniae]QFZ30689.1 hypothetical protein EJF16_11133 [Clavispora lusitaniae]
MVKQYLSLATFKTASRCWMPAYAQQPASRFFSSRQRCINFNNVDHENRHLVSNDDAFSAEDVSATEQPFEPTVFSSDEVFTAGPVNKA